MWVDIAFSFFRFDFYFLQLSMKVHWLTVCNLAVFLGPSVRIYAFPGNLINSSSNSIFSVRLRRPAINLNLKVGLCLKCCEHNDQKSFYASKLIFLNNCFSYRHTFDVIINMVFWGDVQCSFHIPFFFIPLFFFGLSHTVSLGSDFTWLFSHFIFCPYL